MVSKVLPLFGEIQLARLPAHILDCPTVSLRLSAPTLIRTGKRPGEEEDWLDGADHFIGRRDPNGREGGLDVATAMATPLAGSIGTRRVSSSRVRKSAGTSVVTPGCRRVRQ